MRGLLRRLCFVLWLTLGNDSLCLYLEDTFGIYICIVVLHHERYRISNVMKVAFSMMDV